MSDSTIMTHLIKRSTDRLMLLHLKRSATLIRAGLRGKKGAGGSRIWLRGKKALILTGFEGRERNERKEINVS